MHRQRTRAKIARRRLRLNRTVKGDPDKRHAIRIALSPQVGFALRQDGHDRAASLQPTSVALGIALPGEMGHCGEQSHDLMLPKLCDPAHAMTRQAGVARHVDELWRWRKLVQRHVEIQTLQRGRCNEIPPPRQNAGAGRPPQNLAP